MKIKNPFKKVKDTRVTNDDVFSKVFDATIPLLQQDEELSVELTNETAPPLMSEMEED